MKRVVIVLIVPIHDSRRHITVLEKLGEPSQGLDYRLAHLRIVGMQFAVWRDQILATIGDQMRVKRRQRIHAVGADSQA